MSVWPDRANDGRATYVQTEIQALFHSLLFDNGKNFPFLEASTLPHKALQ
jgi:hypothetical protein